MIRPLNLSNNLLKNYDFCIVGTGPAGITLAVELSNKGYKIALLEAGGLEYSEYSQNFYECESLGHEGWHKLTRLRFFGGTSNHWSGRCRPFERADFDRETINGLPGWPINYSEIEPYLNPAMKIIDLDINRGFQPINKPWGLDNFKPDSSAHSTPTRFKEKYFEQLNSNKSIDCLYNATALDLTLDPAKQSVQTISVSNSTHGRSSISANNFILCMGGIENARFLLNCNQQISVGIGNINDMVGRCFMEHLNVSLGSFIYKNPDDFSAMQFYTSSNFSAKADIGSSNVTLGIIRKVKSYGRTKAIKDFFKSLACNMDVAEKVQFISDFKCPGMGNISTLMEQSPNLDSRIMLSKKRDNLGLPRAIFDWRINDYDLRTIQKVGTTFAKEFAKAGLGNVKLADFVLGQDLNAVKFSRHAHHMGTTRMSHKPEYGVVDENLKVHGIDNLYIAGSSIFSTGGACNPTMPIIQFCLRLADHLIA
jgi:choline dehydrogenase-like flavoprotein